MCADIEFLKSHSSLQCVARVAILYNEFLEHIRRNERAWVCCSVLQCVARVAVCCTEFLEHIRRNERA